MGDERSASPVLLGVSLKLYLDVDRSERWAHAVADIARAHPAVRDGAVELFVLPSLPALPAVRDALDGTGVRVGAQDLHWEDRGAFTGAVSGQDLRFVGCELVEVGHAERGAVFGETPEVFARKLAAACRNGLTPVLCIGEAERGDADAAAQECIRQAESALSRVETVCPELIVAYEPQWAIGQDRPASVEHIRTVIAALRAHLGAETRFGRVAVIYGGSAQPGTLTALGGGADGLFLGRFAHDPAALARIVDEAAALA